MTIIPKHGTRLGPDKLQIMENTFSKAWQMVSLEEQFDRDNKSIIKIRPTNQSNN